ncbi:hypothetical protein JHK82_016113 [Glycine max]|nr:hypothetical protein JHK85_016513 [Glycine max]KAG5046736.1 hypothetical protein JHK86_016142 [Glycine max]KAG5149232.1 hypothetical protein JHK82_016113 [Glycine max]
MWIAILKLNQRIERLEWERIIARQEIIHEGNGEEQLRLLKDIQSQLQIIQSKTRSLKTIKATPKDDVSLASLQEAKYEMVYLPSPLTGEKLCPFHDADFHPLAKSIFWLSEPSAECNTPRLSARKNLEEG